MSMTSFAVTEIEMEEDQLAISEMILVRMLNHISLNTQKTYFLNYFELLPNTKPIVVGTNYRPPHQTHLMETFNENLSKVETNSIETYILGNFNINLLQNGHYVFQKLIYSHVNQFPMM